MMADNIGCADLSSYGGTNPTPRIDSIPARGVRLTNYRVASAVCTLTRVSVLTGRYPLRYDVRSHFNIYSEGKYLPNAGSLTPAEALGDNGYATYHVGKWHLGVLGDAYIDQDGIPTLREHGFDRFLSPSEQSECYFELIEQEDSYSRGGECLLRNGNPLGQDEPRYPAVPSLPMILDRRMERPMIFHWYHSGTERLVKYDYDPAGVLDARAAIETAAGHSDFEACTGVDAGDKWPIRLVEAGSAVQRTR